MSDSTTPAPTPPGDAAVSLAKLRSFLRSKPGRARGRTAEQDVLDRLFAARRGSGDDAEALAAWEAGAEVPLSGALMQRLIRRFSLNGAAVTAATVAPSAAAEPVIPPPATGSIPLGANGGTATLAVPGTPVAANGVGWWASVSLLTRDPVAGTRGGAEVALVVKREAGDASVAAIVTNRFGTMFGATGDAGAAVTVAATCPADGATVTLAFSNAAATERTVAHAVRRVAG